jgi:hypothetical protein
MAMRSQKLKHTARLEKMTGYRLRIQQLTLLIRSTLHPPIIPNNTDQPTDRHAELFRTLLALHSKAAGRVHRDPPAALVAQQVVPAGEVG